jgi:hypothetical protein
MDQVHGPWLMGSWYRNSSRIVQPEIYDPDFLYRKGIYPSNLGHTGKIGRWDGWLRPRTARAHAHGGVPWPSVMARWSLGFLKPWWSVFDEVFSYGITATKELDQANLNWRRATTESSNGEVPRPALSVDVYGLQQCPDPKNRGGTFLATSSCS